MGMGSIGKARGIMRGVERLKRKIVVDEVSRVWTTQIGKEQEHPARQSGKVEGKEGTVYVCAFPRVRCD